MSMNRRSFLKVSAWAFAASPILARALGARGGQAFAADASLPLAKESEEPAKTLKYCSNADKPGPNCSARKDAAKKGQYCFNCQLYSKLEGDQKGSKGKCMIMPKNRVQGSGWCQSWVQNPAIKA